MANTPIMRGTSYNGEIPTKCQICANKVHDGARWICGKHPEGKFVAKIGFTCFEWPKKK